MTWTVSIGLYAKADKLPDVADALYRRLLVRGQLQGATLYEGWPDINAKPTHLSLSAQQMASLAREIFSDRSDKAFRVELGYELSSGKQLPLDLWLRGPNYMERIEAAVQGPLELSCQDTDLCPWLPDLMREHGISAGYDARFEELDLQTATLLFKQRDEGERKNNHELFFSACGTLDDEGGLQSAALSDGLEHAIMHTDIGYPSLVMCFAVFHRDPAEFGRDFERIYLEYNRGIHLPMTLIQGANLWELRPPELNPRWEKGKWGIGVPGQENATYYPYSEFGKNSAPKFLEGLTEAKVNALARLSGETIRRFLTDTKTREDLPKIEVHDLGEHGMALTTEPSSSIWRAYKYIADFLGPICKL